MPALALPTGPGVGAGKNIGVFHNLDFVAAFGYDVGEQLTIDVYRGPHRIATAFGPAVEVNEGLPKNGALEVNHGPEGPAAQGDCWEGVTPDILPGDRVVITSANGTVTDEVLVDDIAISGPPQEDLSTTDDTDIIVEGHARFADGTPILVERLDSGEVRLGTTFRANPNTVEATDTNGGWRATYKTPYAAFKGQDLPLEDQKQAILDGDHAMGYGHVAPLPPETQLVEGLGGGGPALGCESAPKSPPNAITTSDDKFVNLGSESLKLSGTAAADVTAVSVTLSDGAGNITDPVAATELTDPIPGPGDKAWSVEIPRASIDLLNDGTLTATGTYQLSDGSPAPGETGTKTIVKDTQAPGLPTATSPAGAYFTTLSVTLNQAASDSDPAGSPAAKIHYNVGDGTQLDPTALSSVFGSPISIPATQTIKALTIDGAGNPGPALSSKYTISNPVFNFIPKKKKKKKRRR